ncbi:MAG: DNA polymerase IV [Firmicutes bacterium]|nr:DNA polymerase IV [Bacillota bacterium]
MDRVILHVDANGFYASCECAVRPEISGLPVIVGGSVELRKGIVLAKNELAKKYGIYTGMNVREAMAKCPGLVSLEPDYALYTRFSRDLQAIYYRYTDQIEGFGLDEAWTDMTGSTHLFGDGKSIADQIRETVRRELGITVSVGVSFNKIYAKLGSDMRKPNATTVITRENFKARIWPLPAADLLYVGPASAKKLREAGIRTIGQLAAADESLLGMILGKWGTVLGRFANGLDDSPVAKVKESWEAEPSPKSVGNSVTLPRDVSTAEDVRKVFYQLSESVASRLRETGLKAKTVQICVCDNAFAAAGHQGQLPYPSCLTAEIAEKAAEIYNDKYVYKRPIRGLGVRTSNFAGKNAPEQLDLFGDCQNRWRHEKLELMVDSVRRRYGHFIIQRGMLMEDAALTGENPRDHTVHPVSYFDGPIV